MSLRKDLAKILARDPRYSVHAYQFVMDAFHELDTKRRRPKPKIKRPDRARGKSKSSSSSASMAGVGGSSVDSRHISGQSLCEAVRELAMRRFGMMALCVFRHWGVESTSDIGNIVFNLIESGDLQKRDCDSRADFDQVFDFSDAFNQMEPVALDE